MRSSLALGFVLLAGFLAGGPAHASFSDEHLKLLNTEVVADRSSVVFSGLIENTHPSRSVNDVTIYITLKQYFDGRAFIIDIIRGFPNDSFVAIAPGEQRPFEVVAPYGQRDYDEYSIRVDGALAFVFDGDLVTGEVVIVEESLTWTWNDEGETLVYGEIYNGTNVVVGRLNPTFTLKSGSRDVGITAIANGFNRLNLVELLPGETVEFMAVSATNIDAWDRYVVDLYYEPLRLYEADIATGVEEVSWGQIKNHSRVENAE